MRLATLVSALLPLLLLCAARAADVPEDLFEYAAETESSGEDLEGAGDYELDVSPSASPPSVHVVYIDDEYEVAVRTEEPSDATPPARPETSASESATSAAAAAASTGASSIPGAAHPLARRRRSLSSDKREKQMAIFNMQGSCPDDLNTTRAMMYYTNPTVKKSMEDVYHPWVSDMSDFYCWFMAKSKTEYEYKKNYFRKPLKLEGIWICCTELSKFVVNVDKSTQDYPKTMWNVYEHLKHKWSFDFENPVSGTYPNNFFYKELDGAGSFAKTFANESIEIHQPKILYDVNTQEQVPVDTNHIIVDEGRWMLCHESAVFVLNVKPEEYSPSTMGVSFSVQCSNETAARARLTRSRMMRKAAAAAAAATTTTTTQTPTTTQEPTTSTPLTSTTPLATTTTTLLSTSLATTSTEAPTTASSTTELSENRGSLFRQAYVEKRGETHGEDAVPKGRFGPVDDNAPGKKLSYGDRCPLRQDQEMVVRYAYNYPPLRVDDALELPPRLNLTCKIYPLYGVPRDIACYDTFVSEESVVVVCGDHYNYRLHVLDGNSNLQRHDPVKPTRGLQWNGMCDLEWDKIVVVYTYVKDDPTYLDEVFYNPMSVQLKQDCWSYYQMPSNRTLITAQTMRSTPCNQFYIMPYQVGHICQDKYEVFGARYPPGGLRYVPRPEYKQPGFGMIPDRLPIRCRTPGDVETVFIKTVSLFEDGKGYESFFYNELQSKAANDYVPECYFDGNDHSDVSIVDCKNKYFNVQGVYQVCMHRYLFVLHLATLSAEADEETVAGFKKPGNSTLKTLTQAEQDEKKRRDDAVPVEAKHHAQQKRDTRTLGGEREVSVLQVGGTAAAAAEQRTTTRGPRRGQHRFTWGWLNLSADLLMGFFVYGFMFMFFGMLCALACVKITGWWSKRSRRTRRAELRSRVQDILARASRAPPAYERMDSTAV